MRSYRQLRSRNRKVLAWSLAVAAAIHVAVFTLSPDFDVAPMDGSAVAGAEPRSGGHPTTVLRLVFGPPSISASDGGVWQEPPDRVLHTTRLTEIPMLCTHLESEGSVPLRGAIRLRVNRSGHALAIDVAETTGDWCGDRVLVRAADALLYHWLPNERFPAPVTLVQPVTLERVGG